MMAQQLRAQHLEKRYQSRLIVKDISLDIGNEIVGLLGPNGAGKTKSFNLLAGLEFPDKGDIYLNDRKITSLPLHQRARMGIGYLPQESSIFRKLSVQNNILAALELQTQWSKKERQKKCNDLLAEFQLSYLHHTISDKLSGGEKRRVEIARALAMEPQFILLDEPFAGIDPISISGIKANIIQLYQRGIGVLITDHNVLETLTICHRAYIVNDGYIIAHGTPRDILANDTVKQAYLGTGFHAFQPLENLRFLS
jgi:lipopolysaccharide export system ATP-binding protein